MIKASSQTSNWVIVDNMRGLPVGADDARLLPNTSDAETTTFNQADISATGFGPPSGGSNPYGASQTYIYIAIRRGPMKVPTSGTSVFSPEAFTGNATTRTIGNITTDSLFLRERASDSWNLSSRLIGSDNYLETNSTAAEGTATAGTRPSFTKAQLGVVYNGATKNQSSTDYIDYLFRRAPGFFDVVCYTGTGVARTVAHNLGVVPEMMIVKCRSNGGSSQYFWAVYVAPLGNTANLVLSDNSAVDNGNEIWNMTTPTSSVFTVGPYNRGGASGLTYVAYLFATCAGVSKVGSYTGTATTKQIDCGFAAGARFVLIKRTDSTGDWYVWDTARGIVSGNDPYLLLNTTAAEVTSTDYIDTYSAGFEISSTAPAAINASGGTFIFLAIA
jgi:hypothetical protein